MSIRAQISPSFRPICGVRGLPFPLLFCVSYLPISLLFCVSYLPAPAQCVFCWLLGLSPQAMDGCQFEAEKANSQTRSQFEFRTFWRRSASGAAGIFAPVGWS